MGANTFACKVVLLWGLEANRFDADVPPVGFGDGRLDEVVDVPQGVTAPFVESVARELGAEETLATDFWVLDS